MQRRRTRSLSPKRADHLEHPRLSWANITAHFETLQNNADKAQTTIKQFGGVLVAYKGKLEGDEVSISLANISRLARQFRKQTREYMEELEEVLDSLEQENIAMSTVLDVEYRRGKVVVAASSDKQVASSDQERLDRLRLELNRLQVDHWLLFRHSQSAPRPSLSSFDSSSSHSDQRSGIPPRKPKRKLNLLKSMKMPSPKAKSREEDADESGAVTGDEGPLGLTDDSRGVPDGRPSSGGAGGLGASSSQRGDGRSSSADGGGGAASSGDSEAGGSAASGDGVPSEEPTGQGEEDQGASPSSTSTIQNRYAVNTSFQVTHSATSGDEADCEPETTTTPVVSTTTDSSNSDSNGNGNGNGNEIVIPNGKIIANGKSSVAVNVNGNAVSNGKISMQSSASQTDESWIAWDCVELGELNKLSPWSVLHELSRQQALVRVLLLHHLERLASPRLVRLHLRSQTHALRASRLLRGQLAAAVRAIASELRAVQHALGLRRGALRLLHASVWDDRPLRPTPRPPALPPTHQQVSDQAAGASATTTTSRPDVPTPPQPQLKSTHQESLGQTAESTATPASRRHIPPLKTSTQQMLGQAVASSATTPSRTHTPPLQILVKTTHQEVQRQTAQSSATPASRRHTPPLKTTTQQMLGQTVASSATTPSRPDTPPLQTLLKTTHQEVQGQTAQSSATPARRRHIPPLKLSTQQMLAHTVASSATTATRPHTPPPEPQFKTTHQELLAQAAAIGPPPTSRPRVVEAMHRAVDLLRGLSSQK